MEISEIAARLTGTKPCSELTTGEAERLARLGDIRELAAGEDLYREGQPAAYMVFLLEGAVEAWKLHPERGEVRLTQGVAGELVGEIALLRSGDRMATVRATEPTCCFVVRRDTFENLVDEGDMIAYKLGLKMARNLADRLAWVNEILFDFVNGPEPADEFDVFKRQLLSQWDF